MERSAPELTNTYSRRPVPMPWSSRGVRSKPGIAASVDSGMVNEVTSVRWSAVGGPCIGVMTLTGPGASTVGSEPAKGREDVFVDMATVKADATAHSALRNSFGRLLHIELPHLVMVVPQPGGISGMPSDRCPRTLKLCEDKSRITWSSADASQGAWHQYVS